MFSDDYTHATVYSPPDRARLIHDKGWYALSLMTIDQIWFVPLLADCRAAIVNGQGLLFIGHSDAGKSTAVTMLKAAASRAGHSVPPQHRAPMAVSRNSFGGGRVARARHVEPRRRSGGFVRVRAASGSAFLRQDTRNEIERMGDRMEIWRSLLATLVKPLATTEWWLKELNILERLVNDAAFYAMHFDRLGAVVSELLKLTGDARS